MYDQHERRKWTKAKRQSMLPPVLSQISETPKASKLQNVYDQMTLEDVRQHIKDETWKKKEYKKQQQNYKTFLYQQMQHKQDQSLAEKRQNQNQEYNILEQDQKKYHDYV